MMPKKSIFLFLLLSIVICGQFKFSVAQDMEEIKDPFLSIDDKMKMTQETFDIAKLPYPINLKGIIWSEGAMLAIINDEMVEKGQKWRDFLIEDIQKEKVVLRLGNSRLEIPLKLEKKNETK